MFARWVLVMTNFERSLYADPDADLENREAVLPPLAEGDELAARELTAASHTTQPPARVSTWSPAAVSHSIVGPWRG